MQKVMNLTFSSSIADIVAKNQSFDSCVIRIAYVGENRNKTFISKEAFESALPSIYCCPIVCNYDVASDTLGGHDIELVKDDKGALKLINATTPIGCIPESAKVWFENYTGDDGIEREYLYAEALLWKRQAAYEKIKADGITNQSMEIAINDGESIDGIYHINDFEFTAFTAIGVDPCFEDAAIETFSLQSFKDQLTEMMADYSKEIYTLANTSDGDNEAPDGDCNNTHPHTFTKGETKTLEQKIKLAKEYGIDVESLEFSLEDFSLEELEEKFKAMKADYAVETVDAEEDADAETEEFALNRNVNSEIIRELHTVERRDRWGVRTYYWLEDYDLDAGKVYVCDPADNLYYALDLSFDGDKAHIDFSTQKRVKLAFVDFVEGDEPEIDPERITYQEAFDQAHQDLINIQEEYSALKENVSEMNTELEALREFKLNIEKAENEAAIEAVFAQFEDLADVDEFKELREKVAEFDIETLTEKCFAIRGKQVVAQNFSLESPTPVIKVKRTNTSPKPYGGIVEKYLGEID